MIERGHAAVEFALAVAVLMLPVAIVVMAFGPWSEKRVFAESAAAEAARATVVQLDHGAGADVVMQIVNSYGLDHDLVRLGWCGADPAAVSAPAGSCPLVRGSNVAATIEAWTPLINTPWGGVGGLWVAASHVEPIDLYRSFP